MGPWLLWDSGSTPPARLTYHTLRSFETLEAPASTVTLFETTIRARVRFQIRQVDKVDNCNTSKRVRSLVSAVITGKIIVNA